MVELQQWEWRRGTHNAFQRPRVASAQRCAERMAALLEMIPVAVHTRRPDGRGGT
jgi:hypothetical protein